MNYVTTQNRVDALKPQLLRKLELLRERFPEGGWVQTRGSDLLVSGYSDEVRRLAFFQLAAEGKLENRVIAGVNQYRAPTKG